MEAAMVKVYFATNRNPDPAANFGFGAAMAPTDNPSTVRYATAEVQNISLADETSGTITGIAEVTAGGYADQAVSEIIGAGKNLLVFIHGFDNSFEDAIKRAAFNAEWLRASGAAAADTTVLAFSWPSAGTIFSFPHVTYESDQAQAGLSGYHIGQFLNIVDNLRRDYKRRNPGGKIFLLAHSMGNHALQAGVEWWFAQSGPAELFFDETILAAADEVDDTFEAKNGAKLSSLPGLTGRISIFHSRRDVAMYLSTTVNLDSRLGFDGPDDKKDQTLYPPAKFRVVDCTAVTDYDLDDPPDATHQYYRRSLIVRADIATVLGGGGGGGLQVLKS
jgi:esterase/lipase superfamily enzyme